MKHVNEAFGPIAPIHPGSWPIPQIFFERPSVNMARSVSRGPNRHSRSPSCDLSRSRPRSRDRATHRDHVVGETSLPGYEDHGYDYARRDSTPSIEAVSIGFKSGAIKVSRSLCKELKGWLVTPLAN